MISARFCLEWQVHPSTESNLWFYRPPTTDCPYYYHNQVTDLLCSGKNILHSKFLIFSFTICRNWKKCSIITWWFQRCKTLREGTKSETPFFLDLIKTNVVGCVCVFVVLQMPQKFSNIDHHHNTPVFTVSKSLLYKNDMHRGSTKTTPLILHTTNNLTVIYT